MKQCIRNLAAAGLAAGLAAGNLAAEEINYNKASLKPIAALPVMAKPPTIDGEIGAGEWNSLHVSRFVSQNADLLQRAHGEFWIGRDDQNLYIAVRSAVHPTAGAVVKYDTLIPGKDVRDVVFDDSIELWFHNAPEGGDGDYFQVMVNPAGVLFDQSYDASEKIGRTYWRADMEQAHQVKDGLWIAEFAIKLESLGIGDASDVLAMRVCRNYKWQWNQSRWGAGVHAFDSPETMPTVKFIDQAPVVNEVGFQDDKGINVAVELSNTTNAPLPVNVKLGYNAESQPRYYDEKSVTLAPGKTQLFEYRKDFFTPDNYPALAEIQVTGQDGTVFYHRDVRWHTRPEGEYWVPMGDKSAEEAVLFGFEFHPSWKTLRWKADYAGMKGREDIKQVRLVVTPKDGGKPVHESAYETNENFIVPVQTQELKKLKDGMYQAAIYLDADKPGTESVKSVLFEMKSDYEWLGNDIGKADIVIPPFTPMQVKGGTVATVLREHELGDNGLWKQIVAEGTPVLAAPMRIEVVRDGKAEAADGKAKITGRKATEVKAQSTWKAPGVKGRTAMDIEYDGCARITLSFEPTDDQPIDGLRLVIPLKDSVAPLMHAVGDGIRFNYGGRVPAGDGRVWASDKASRNDFLGTFLPYIWVGGESRGLCWFAGNDSDWIVDPELKTAALELHRTDGVLELVVNVVQLPTTLDRKHEIVFGLQATPTRPMPDNWRQMGVTSRVPVDYKILGMTKYWGGNLYTVVPRERDYEIIRKITDAATEAERDDAYIEAYKKKYPDIQAEINWSAQPGKAAGVIPYTNLRGGFTRLPEWFTFQDEWRNAPFSPRVAEPGAGGTIDFVVALPPSRVDYLLYHYKKFIENGFSSIYWDNIYIEANKNAVTSNAYTMPVGGIQPEGDIWQVREVTKRTAVMLHQMGKPNASVPHTTNAFLIPAFSWTGFNLAWEWKYGAADFQDRFTRDYTRACTIGRTAGSVPLILQGITGVKSSEKRAWVERTRIAVCVPHEIKVWQTDGLFMKLTQAMIAMGYGEDAKVYNYWEENPVVTVDGLESAWLVVEGKDKIMLVISDYGNGGTAKVTLDTKRLGLPANFTAVNWENPNDKTTAANGTIALPNFRKHDFRALVIGK